MDDKFDIGIYVYCIEKFDDIEVGRCFYINASGNMMFAPTHPKKSGYGFGMKDEFTNIDYYLTYSEMEKYFITSDEFYKNGILYYTRELRIEEILK